MSMFANRKDRTLYVYDGAANYIVAYIFQIVLQLLFTIVLIATMTIDERQVFSHTSTYVYIICIVNELSIGLAPLTYSKVLGQNYYKDMGFDKKLDIKQILMLIAIALFTICAFAPLATFVKQFFDLTGFDSSNLTNLAVTDAGSLIGGIILLAILPAVVEEILYRGMIARAFSRKGFVFAIFMGGFMFAIMHGNPVQFVHQFFMGVVCCIVYFATGSIYASIIVHFVNNTVAIVGSYIAYLHPYSVPTYAAILMIVFGIIILAILLYVFILYVNKNAKLSRGIKAFNEVFSECFNKKVDDDKQELINIAIKESGIEEIQEVYDAQKIIISQDEALKSRRAMIFAIFLAAFVFIVNTISGYIN